MFRKRSILLMKFHDVKPRAPQISKFFLLNFSLERFNSISLQRYVGKAITQSNSQLTISHWNNFGISIIQNAG